MRLKIDLLVAAAAAVVVVVVVVVVVLKEEEEEHERDGADNLTIFILAYFEFIIRYTSHIFQFHTIFISHERAHH